eukprot:TRINITY_DN2753_c0_g1_i4.p1 TRINITY_DN2753_c0_g1~~TRINITY_DN2753_c0_g1_i4.p1  ORF type:complete len:344 (+),score=84.39 TRINITY_DN2753_c0_g1_i4:54-1085(+)
MDTDESNFESKEKTETNPNAGGGGGWWGLWSSAVSTVNSVGDIVKPAVNSVVLDISKVIGEEDEPEEIDNNSNKATRDVSFDSPKSNESEKDKDSKDLSDENIAKVFMNDFENAIDQGSTILNNTSNFFSSMWQQGLDKVKNSEEMAFISQKAKNVAKSSKQVLEEVTQTANYHEAANHSLEALEAVGKKAIELLTEEGGTPERPRMHPRNYDEQPIVKPTVPSKKEKDFTTYFESFLGQAHIKAVELIGTESLLKAQRIQLGLTPAQLTEYAALVIVLQQLFDVDNAELERVDTEIPLLKINQKAKSLYEKILANESAISQHNQDLFEEYQNGSILIKSDWT